MKQFLKRALMLSLFATIFLTATPAMAGDDTDSAGNENDPIELPPMVCIYDPETFTVIYCYIPPIP